MIGFPPFISNGRLLEAGILVRNVKKMDILRVQIGGWAFIRAWAFIRDFTVICMQMQDTKIYKFKKELRY